MYLTPPLKGFPLDLVTVQGSEKTGMMGLPDSRKSFKIDLAILTQYRHVMDGQTDRAIIRQQVWAMHICVVQ